MRWGLALSVFCLLPLAAAADEITSAYSPVDLRDCEQIEMPDGYLFEGSWRCKGYGGFDILLAGADARNFVGFGKSGGNNCAFSKTFQLFNTALSPIEWRLRSGKPFAAIERWSVTSDGSKSVTWLVVNALRRTDSCHVHYVPGSHADANEAARHAADNLAEAFSCENDVPTFDSKIGPPPIELSACKDVARE
jgi:hypothetical protein